MLALFRRFTNSRVGVIIAFAVLLLIAVGFGLGDVAGLRTGSGGLGGGSAVKVGGERIAIADLTRASQTGLESARQQNPQLTMAAFVAGGGFDAVLERMVSGLAAWEFGRDQGMRVSKKLVDGQLASYPSLRGPTGKFDQRLYEQILRDQRLTDAQIRRDIAQGIMADHLLSRLHKASQMPAGLAAPYADLLLERRQGQVAFVPAAAMPPGAAPTAAEVQGWYRRNIARYSLPERRIVRYAVVTPDRVRAVPSEAEVARSYAENRARYQATEKRTITQVTVLTQAGAAALAAGVRGGTPLAEAARAAGLEPRTLANTEKAAYAGQSSPAVADAVFAAAQGSVVGPLRAQLGFVIARVDAVQRVPGRTLAEARDEIVTTLTQQKSQEALTRLQDTIGGAIDGNATFAEIVSEQKLAAQATPPVAANGIVPETGKQLDAALAQVVGAGFAAAEGDAPSVVPFGNGGFAVAAVDRIIRPAPRPLAKVREQVVRDFTADRARRAAQQVADGIAARAGRGMSLQQAVAASGVSLPAVRPISAPRAVLARSGQTSPELGLLFSLRSGASQVIPASDGAGWRVVRLDRVTPGNSRGSPQVMAATRREVGQLLGIEYAQQFTTAFRREAGVQRDSAALAQLRRDLIGGGSDR